MLGIQAEAKMKTGALVPDTMILRLIINELTTRGWIQDSNLRPYHVYSSSTAVDTDETVDSVMIPSDFRTSRWISADSYTGGTD